jgi:hypothetical protein
MLGTLSGGDVELRGRQWLTAVPPGYDFVGLSAKYDASAPDSLEGNALGLGCTTFSLTRTS